MIKLSNKSELYRLFRLNTNYHKIYDYYIDNVCIGTFLIETINYYHILWKVKIYDEFRGKGYGKKMMQDILTTFKKDIYLYLRKDNTIAIKLYEKFGFKLNNDKIKNLIRPIKNLGLVKYKLSINEYNYV